MLSNFMWYAIGSRALISHFYNIIKMLRLKQVALENYLKIQYWPIFDVTILVSFKIYVMQSTTPCALEGAIRALC